MTKCEPNQVCNGAHGAHLVEDPKKNTFGGLSKGLPLVAHRGRELCETRVQYKLHHENIHPSINIQG